LGGLHGGVLVDHQAKRHGGAEARGENRLDLGAYLLAVGAVRLVGEGEHGGAVLRRHETAYPKARAHTSRKRCKQPVTPDLHQLVA
jgi:hypothetical protein